MASGRQHSGSVVYLALLAAIVGLCFGQDSHAQSRTRNVPLNASADVRGGWTCNDGYLKRDNGCVSVAQATDAEVRQLMIERSVSAYSGSCPCPFSSDRAGRRCGGRSAYSRPGGASPLCYAADVSEAALKQFRTKYPAKK